MANEDEEIEFFETVEVLLYLDDDDVDEKLETIANEDDEKELLEIVGVVLDLIDDDYVARDPEAVAN